MRTIAMTGVAVALLTIPVYAQQPGGPPPYMGLPSNKEEQAAARAATDRSLKTKEADDKAYKSALDAIPTKPKQAYDPWGNVRQKPQPNSK